MQVGVCCFHVFAHNSQRLSRGLQDAPAHSGRQHGTQLVEPLSPLCVRNHGEYEGTDTVAAACLRAQQQQAPQHHMLLNDACLSARTAIRTIRCDPHTRW